MLNKSNSYIKKILYIALVFLLTAFLIAFSYKNQASVSNIRMHFLSFYLPEVKLVDSGFKLLTQNHKEHKSVANTFCKIISTNSLEFEESYNQINEVYNKIKTQKLKMLYVSPSYYASSGFINDVIFTATDEDIDLIKVNLPVLSKKGLFGRVASIKNNLINIVSIFNDNSRIPAYTTNSNIYGVVAGDGSDIKFIYPNSKVNKIEEGETVFTSGENDLFMPNIPIGVIRKKENNFMIEVFTKKRAPILGIIINN